MDRIFRKVAAGHEKKAVSDEQRNAISRNQTAGGNQKANISV